MGRVLEVDGQPKANELQWGYQRQLSGYCVGRFGPEIPLQTDVEGLSECYVPPCLIDALAEFPYARC